VLLPSKEGGALQNIVSQEDAIFPWKTVTENDAFGLEMRGIPRSERQEIAPWIGYGKQG
jgi:ABC-type taurine transport system ATPase subunit